MIHNNNPQGEKENVGSGRRTAAPHCHGPPQGYTVQTGVSLFYHGSGLKPNHIASHHMQEIRKSGDQCTGSVTMWLGVELVRVITARVQNAPATSLVSRSNIQASLLVKQKMTAYLWGQSVTWVSRLPLTRTAVFRLPRYRVGLDSDRPSGLEASWSRDGRDSMKMKKTGVKKYERSCRNVESSLMRIDQQQWPSGQ
ncbi:uncharacterized protein An08g02750 [Aspergillus niger]|uniref:Contig An08c0100, genomic contig n=2 Tax=Aspergillus niger TaxID=5061 RepID=A2QQJ6_ASPNC|nr:uncharacterized protein An08g02750 [Aspergillus niger]CAK45312.1 unnamed protein product [Aspergillus niger]